VQRMEFNTALLHAPDDLFELLFLMPNSIQFRTLAAFQYTLRCSPITATFYFEKTHHCVVLLIRLISWSSHQICTFVRKCRLQAPEGLNKHGIKMSGWSETVKGILRHFCLAFMWCNLLLLYKSSRLWLFCKAFAQVSFFCNIF